MNRKYYSLVVKAADGRWYVQFGDYNKQTVIDERDDVLCGYDQGEMIKKKDVKIITTGSKQSYINAAVAALNAEIAA